MLVRLVTDVRIALARRRGERSAHWQPFERLVDWAITGRDLYIPLDLPGPHTCEVEAVGETTGGTYLYGRLAFLVPRVPVVDRLRNVSGGQVPRPYPIVRTHPVYFRRWIAVAFHVATVYVGQSGAIEYRARALGLGEGRRAGRGVDFDRFSGWRARRGGTERKLSGAETETFRDTLRHHLRGGQKDCRHQSRTS